MVYVESIGSGAKISCLRSYGRANVNLHSSLSTPHGSVRCLVLDLSIGGARVVMDQTMEVGEALWLSLHKVKVFGSVQWVRGKEIGVKFEEKLPKALVLSLRGDNVDPQALEAIEAMLVAQDWAVGTPAARPKSVRIAEVLGAPNQNLARSGRSGGVAAPRSVGDSRTEARSENGIVRQALLLILFSAVTGALIGIATVLVQ